MENMRLAVLIDGDNAPRDCLKSIMEEIAIYGTPMIKRIYGDWASQGLTSWKNSLLENAVTPKQQFAYTTGKNATDSAMIIDAMDILYTARPTAMSSSPRTPTSRPWPYACARAGCTSSA